MELSDHSGSYPHEDKRMKPEPQDERQQFILKHMENANIEKQPSDDKYSK